MLSANDIVLIDMTHSIVNNKLEIWRQNLKCKRFRLNRTKIEYVECNDVTREADVEVRIGTQAISKRGSFKYLRSTIQGNDEINEDITYHIRAGDDMEACGGLCDKNVS